MAERFWLTEAQMAWLRPLLPNKPARRAAGGPPCAPAAYGPRNTLYNRLPHRNHHLVVVSREPSRAGT